MSAGSSPLVRGAPRDGDGCAVRAGIIPARAGSTTLPGPPASGRGDHPRSCGEHWLNHQHRTWSEGSSPLVRGARAPSWCLFSAHGIIPARAGSTNMYYQTHPILQDHPRSCGEHPVTIARHGTGEGSSPLVRGAPVSESMISPSSRIIPARARSTCLGIGLRVCLADHPRSCGEHVADTVHVAVWYGSSPLVRGAPDTIWSVLVRCGIIPARAGSTRNRRR